MSLVAFDGTPLVMVGAAHRHGAVSLANMNTTVLDAANEACIFTGHVFNPDGGSHTIDTSGSSSIGWLASSVTFSNAGTTVKVGIAAQATTGPPVRAANASDVISFDVSKSLTGGGGGITNAWKEHTPDTGTKTIAHGDLVAVAIQMTARGGSDSVSVNWVFAPAGGTLRPSVTAFTGGAYGDTAGLPNCVITYSDGSFGFLYGSYVQSAGSYSTQTWNNGSSPSEYGNFLQMPFPAKIYGIMAATTPAANGADLDIILYSDPLGTPAAEKTVSIDEDQVAQLAGNSAITALFSSPYSSTANQPLAAIVKPTTANNCNMVYKSYNASGHQAADVYGTNGYAVNRSSGAFAAQNSSKDRFAIGFLVGAFDAGGGGSGGGSVFGGLGGVVLS